MIRRLVESMKKPVRFCGGLLGASEVGGGGGGRRWAEARNDSARSVKLQHCYKVP